jgi:hypothetical protein
MQCKPLEKITNLIRIINSDIFKVCNITAMADPERGSSNSEWTGRLKDMKRIVFVLVTALFSATLGWSEALVKEFKGKVEFKAATASSWAPVVVGMKFAKGDSISTGFGSQAVLDLGSSVVTVKALTRMTLAELVEKEGTVTTSISLRVGKLNADVKTDTGLKHDFTIKSPVSTAAVRGTEIDFDGETVTTHHGTAILTNEVGQTRSVSAGEQSTTNGFTPPPAPEITKASDSSVPTPAVASGPVITPPAAVVPGRIEFRFTTTAPNYNYW